MFPEILLFTVLTTILFSSPKINFYDSAFFSLISACVLMTWKQYHNEGSKEEAKEKPKDAVAPATEAEARKFNSLFLIAYCLVMASDWIQGIPYAPCHLLCS